MSVVHPPFDAIEKEKPSFFDLDARIPQCRLFHADNFVMFCPLGVLAIYQVVAIHLPYMFQT